jgi:lysophospholipase L1-like esterase
VRVGLTRRRKLLFAALVNGTLLGALEGGLRVGGVRGPAADPPLEWVGADFEGIFPLERDPNLFWRMKAGALQPGMSERISRQGFRGRDFETAKPAGTRRILFLGDSNTFGIGVDVEETFSSLLEPWLNGSGTRYETINLGVPGYSVYQMARLLELQGLALSPDLVVVYAGAWNDFTPAIGHDDETLGTAGAPRRLSLRDARLFQVFQRMLGVSREGREASRREKYISAYGDGHARPDGPRVPVDAFRRLLRTISQRSRAAGSAVVLVVPPAPAFTRARYPEAEEWASAVREVAAETGDLLADARAALVQPNDADKTLFHDEIHPSQAGHSLVAAAVAAEIVKLPFPGVSSLSPDSLRIPVPIDLSAALAKGALDPPDGKRTVYPYRCSVAVPCPSTLRAEVDVPRESFLEIELQFLGAAPGSIVRFEIRARPPGGEAVVLLSEEWAASPEGKGSPGRKHLDLRELGGQTVSLELAAIGRAETATWIRPVIHVERGR